MNNIQKSKQLEYEVEHFIANGGRIKFLEQGHTSYHEKEGIVIEKKTKPQHIGMSPRQQAIQRGDMTYISSPCKIHGKVERYTPSGKCVKCAKASVKKKRAEG